MGSAVEMGRRKDETMPRYEVEYYAGGYTGTRTVNAEDREEAKRKVRGWVRQQMTEPMYADGYTAREVS